MAFNAKGILIVRTGGSDSSGGGFDPGNANFATDLAATSGTTSAPVVTSATYNFVAGDVGARVFIQFGINWTPGWYTIASVASNAATLTASIGDATLYDGTQASSVNTVVGCATTGSPTSGVWGVDYTNQDAAKITFTDMVIDAGNDTQFTSAGNPVGKNFIGNYINVTSGSGFTVQRVEVTSTSGTVATCDKSLGTVASTGGNGKLGGALASPGMAFQAAASAPGAWLAQNDVFIRTGTYTLTSSTSNVSGGKVSISSTGGNANNNVFEGFGTIPCDHGTRPTINAGSISSITIIDITGSRTMVRNIAVDGNSQSSVTGIATSSIVSLIDSCHAANCTGIGLSASSASSVIFKSTATGCSSGSGAILNQNGARALFCEAYSNTTIGFNVGGECQGCISSGNSGGSSDGFQGFGQNESLTNCTSYNNGRHGFYMTGSASALCAILANCIAEGHAAGYGFSASVLNITMKLLNCASYNNASGAIDTSIIKAATISFVTNTTGSFFTNAGSGDFSLNNTVNQGRLARAAGYPGLMPRGLTTGYADIGAAQHADPASMIFSRVQTGF